MSNVCMQMSGEAGGVGIGQEAVAADIDLRDDGCEMLNLYRNPSYR